MKKGDIIRFSMQMKGVTLPGNRKIVRFHCSDTYGIVLGYSFIQEGKVDYSGWYGEPPCIPKPTCHKVLVVEPLTHGDRYIKPVRVLEKDTILVNDMF